MCELVLFIERMNLMFMFKLVKWFFNEFGKKLSKYNIVNIYYSFNENIIVNYVIIKYINYRFL